MTPRDLCLQVAKKPSGGRPMDLLPMPSSTARSNFGRLVRDGLLFRAGNRTDMRYFDSQEKANAFRAESAIALVAEHRRRIPMNKKKPKTTRAGWGPDAPMHFTSETKVTVAPSPPQPTRSNTYPVY